MKKSNQTAIIILFLMVVGLGVFILTQFRGTSTIESLDASAVTTKRQLSEIEVLETVDFGGVLPQFRLYIQTHTGANFVPERIALIDKQTNTTRLDLPLMTSKFPSECMTHNEMDAHDPLGSSMSKWDTNWFTLPEIGPVDTTYSPKLGSRYSVEVIYSNGAVDSYSSINEIHAVCYQVGKNIPMNPDPQDEVPEKE